MSFTRNFSKFEYLQTSKLFNKMLRDIVDGSDAMELSENELLLEQDDDLKTQTRPTKKKHFIFPAIRDGRIDFYWKGGKLFSYDNDFTTHNKYASVLIDENSKTSKQGYVKESHLGQQYRLIKNFSEGYERIKENCGNYSGVEALGVASLYERFSCVANHISDVLVLDIEASFENTSETWDKKSQDRIDIVAFNKISKEIFFIEAKHLSNKDLTKKSKDAQGHEKTKVTLQIERYKEQIINRKDEILLAYSQHVNILNSIFKINLPEPKSVQTDPILLIFGFDAYQKAGKVDAIEKNIKGEGLVLYCKGDITTAKLETIVSVAKK